MTLRLHAFVPRSNANGPGIRAVVWVQGCSLACPGCFNPRTHPFDGGEIIDVEDIFSRIRQAAPDIEGITISGGEPLQQRAGVLALLERVRHDSALSAILFTGYAWDEVQAMPEAERLLQCVDVLIAGRYDARRRLGHGLRGSANQTIHLLSNRYKLEDLENVPQAEVLILADGRIILSGINPLQNKPV